MILGQLRIRARSTTYAALIIITIIVINIDIDIDKVENASATIRKLGLTLPVLPIQVSHLPHSPNSAIGVHS